MFVYALEGRIQQQFVYAIQVFVCDGHLQLFDEQFDVPVVNKV